MKLFDERLTACASPEFLRRHPVAQAQDLRGLPLLQIETRPTAWAVWFEGQGLEAPPVRGMLFDQFAPMTQAAIAGLGIALLPDYLAGPEIAEGRLVPVLERAVAGVGAYWLVWPQARANFPPLEAFRAWLASETAAPRAVED
jgi:DNA-binding transcriptional LysR family regulator